MGIGTLGDFVSSGTARKSRNFDHDTGSVSRLVPFLWRPVCAALFLILLAALLRTQVFQGGYFLDLANGNRVRKVPIYAPRGIIYDRNGVALTVNLPSYRLKNCNNLGQCQTTLISKTQAIELQARGLGAGQSLELDSTRSYPYGPATAHLLGYMSEISAQELVHKPDYGPGDVIGRGGLEQQYESVLRGKNGEEVVEVDALGKKLRTLATVVPIPGKDINTKIDISVQRTAFDQLKDVRGAAVVTDPDLGEVIALVSAPSFDPNVFTDLSLPADYRSNQIAGILSDSSNPLFDRAISGTYPSGSTFKIVTATAGLETGKITESTQITDPGILIIGPYKFPNWLYLRNGGTQGTLNVVSAIQKSNDIFFYHVGEWVGVDDLSHWALKFGLDGKLGIDLPNEAAGSFPTPEWRSRYAPSWYLGDTYHLAIGQGDLLVTPLQVNRWTSVIGNGGKLCKPSVAKNEQLPMNNYQCMDMGLHKKTLNLISQGMVAACSPGGTAWPLFGFRVQSSEFGDKNGSTPSSRLLTPDRVVQVACKTGTAEFGDSKDRTHAWLTAFVDKAEAAKIGKGPIAVTVLVEAGGEGSDIAAPIVKKILEKWMEK